MARLASCEGVGKEYEAAELGDGRRLERLKQIVGLLEADPSSGFPRALGSDAALEGFYRFINNDSFSAEDILAPHRAATFARAERSKTVLAVHDSSGIEYSTPRDGVGYTMGKGHHGYIAHVTLMLSEEGLPLGVGHVETLTRDGTKWRKRKKQGQRSRINVNDPSRESSRWLRGMDAIEHARVGRFEVIHVTDAEGDFFELLAALHEARTGFVIRVAHMDRNVIHEDEDRRLCEVAATIEPSARRDVELTERAYAPRSKALATRLRHPERQARTARLALGATKLTLKKSNYVKALSENFEVNLVRVWEPEPPPGVPTVEWILLTSEDISTPQALERIVDIYRKRWTIEEYFKALKSGCSLEKRQIESYEALRKVLALFVPIAYRLLLLRSLERLDARLPASIMFTRIDLHIMRHAPSNLSLPPPTTLHDALLHLARLGGHLRNNGPPGWQTLAWGYEKLLTLRLGVEIGRSTRSDQS